MRAGALKVVIAMAGIFLAGAVAGGFGTMAWMKHNATRISAQEFVDRQLKKRVEQLELSGAQIEKIQPIMREFEESMRATRRRAFGEMGQQFRELNARIEQELTPEQRTLFHKIQERERERYERATQGTGSGRPPHLSKDRDRGDEPRPPGAKPGTSTP